MTAFIQHLSLLGFGLSLLLCARLFQTWPRGRFCLIPPVTWSIHGLVFYGGVLSGLFAPGEMSTLLSSLLRLHGIALVLGGLLLLVHRASRELREPNDL